jgi:hypothetical protein
LARENTTKKFTCAASQPPLFADPMKTMLYADAYDPDVNNMHFDIRRNSSAPSKFHHYTQDGLSFHLGSKSIK